MILPADHANIISVKNLMEKTYIHMFNNCYFYYQTFYAPVNVSFYFVFKGYTCIEYLETCRP